MALPGSGLVAPSPPRPGQDEIRQLIFRPYQSGEQPAHLRVNDGLEMSHFYGLKLNHLVFAQRFGQCA